MAGTSDEPSSMDLNLLGEVDRACSHARWQAGVSREWERTSALGPFIGLDPVHISTGRLDLLLDEEFELLGRNVSRRMMEHVDGCDACRGALAARLAAR